MASLNNLVNKLKTVGLKKTVQRLIGRFGLKKLRDRVSNLQSFVDNNLVVTDLIFDEDNISALNDEFDGFMCGSDQIWNPSNTRLDSMYWLTFANDNKLKISYAPSIGIESVTDKQKKEIRENLRTFNAISSREESGTTLINKIIGSESCKTVLDPTMLVNRITWDAISDSRLCQGKYIFVYLLRGTKDDRKWIEEYSRKKHMRIVTIPFLDGENLVLYDFKFGDLKLWSATPQDFINAIRYAECVFTDSFHCMVFSCLYHRTFYIFKKLGNHQMNRLIGLHSTLGINSRIISSESTIGDIEKLAPIDWAGVDRKIEERRKISQEYLHSALSCD